MVEFVASLEQRAADLVEQLVFSCSGAGSHRYSELEKIRHSLQFVVLLDQISDCIVTVLFGHFDCIVVVVAMANLFVLANFV